MRPFPVTDREQTDKLFRTAVARHQSGQLREAAELCRRILDETPGNADVLHLRGLALYQLGDFEEAARLIGRAIGINGAAAAYHNNLGAVLQALGRLDEAETALKRAIALEPDDPGARCNLGVLLKTLGRLDEAETVLRQVLDLNPGDAAALNNLGTVLQDQGRLDEAEAALRKAIAAGAATVDVTTNFGDILRRLGRLEEAETVFKHAVELDPEYCRAWYGLAETMRSLDRLAEAIDAWRKVIALSPDFAAEAHFSLASTLASLGQPEEAVANFRRAIELAPGSARIHSNLLMAMHYTPGIDRRQMRDEHRLWASRHTPSGVSPAPLRAPDPERRLRIGFVSDDFRFHAVAHFFLSALEARQRDQWEAVLYSSLAKPDRYTQAFINTADIWRDVRKLDDESLDQRIRDDGIDILVDLDGHSKGNRLLTFARRPAPIQATWLDYVDTTGLDAMDYIIADRFLVPPEDDRYYCERVIRLADDCICYRPPDHAPEVQNSPAAERGYVTFGCFNTTHKITPETIAAWGIVLRRVANARLVLNSPQFGNEFIRARYLSLLGQAGVSAERCQFLHGGQHHIFLSHYREIDISLDTFPYSGGLNTCESLWMGVPVIAFAGERQCGRLAVSHLNNAGFAEFAATDINGYIDKAVVLAGDIPALGEIRSSLRPRMAKSPLTDAPRFAANFTRALRGIWRRACESRRR